MIEKLIKIQSELKTPKNQRNNFGNYNYRSAEDILEAVKPLLKANGLAITITDELVNLGERYYVKAIVKLSDKESEITTSAFAREEETKKGMDQSQITGSASSYARKYALNGMFAIDDTKDADFNNKHDKEEPKETPKIKKATQKQVDELTELATPEYLMKVKEFYIGKGINDLLNADYETIQKAINQCKADAKV